MKISVALIIVGLILAIALVRLNRPVAEYPSEEISNQSNYSYVDRNPIIDEDLRGIEETMETAQEQTWENIEHTREELQEEN